MIAWTSMYVSLNTSYNRHVEDKAAIQAAKSHVDNVKEELKDAKTEIRRLEKSAKESR
jgi:peptidoglycan hydrolase CwlO-like protein